jgi:hypothetical protein
MPNDSDIHLLVYADKKNKATNYKGKSTRAILAKNVGTHLQSQPSRGRSRRLKSLRLSWVLVAHTCNLSYSGGRAQEDRGSKPTPGK